MRRLIVSAALLATTSVGWLTLAGATHATEPAADDWNVRRTYVSTMYVDPTADVAAFASAGGCTVAAQDDSCA
jgi:hypothetical protein